MEKEIYTPQERYLIEAMITHEKMQQALKLDLMLLELEAKADMYEGKELKEWLL